MAFLCSARHLTRLSSRLLSGAAATSSSSLIPASSTALKFPSLSRSAALSTSVLPSLPSSSLTSTPIFTESARRAFSTSEHRYAPSRAPSAILNSNVLDDERLKDLVQPDVWHAFLACRSNGTPMPKALKNSLARAIREWAQSRGCETYALWFSPVRGPLHGEKLETFLGKDFSNGGRLIVDLSGTELFQTETDGSSFPNGGLRVTHRAAAYVAWDTQSSPFIYRNTLYIPAAFVSWNGDALDNKVPLLRSNAAINEQALRVLNHLGDHKSHHVITNVGWEQEFFILDRESYLMRPDLVNTGRCLQGRPPLRGQAQSANYFAKMPLRVRQYMQALREEFWKVGISVKALHNEVAPAQHEVCPIFSATSSAADTNILAMEIMRDLAYEHNLFILFHEKPFKGVNGSGKHLNWGLNTDTGHNLFVLGKSAADRKRFVTFTTAVLRAVRLHGDLLRCSIATAGNDHRLGAHEAPPAIITLGMGAQLEEQLKKIANGNNALDDIHTESDRFLPLVASVPGVTTTVEDRNRTAPIPWCGNRFEFRACGSNQHIAWPLAMLHAAVADSLKHIADQCDAGKSIDEVVRQTLKENQGALFSGNGYDQNILLPHVKKEGLYNLRTSPEAYARLSDAKNVKLLADLKIFSERETLARQQLLQEAFAIDIVIEGNTLLNMLRTGVAPACAKALAEDTVIGKLAESSAALYKPRREAHAALLKEIDLLSTSLDNFPSSSAPAEQAEYALNNIKPILATARKQADILENLVEARLWPYPSLDRVLHRR